MEAGDHLGDGLVEAAGQLLRYNQGLPEPRPGYLNPNVVLGKIYGRCLRHLIGMPPSTPTPYRIPRLSFEAALACVGDADGDLDFAHQIAREVRTGATQPRLAARARRGRTRAGFRVQAQSDAHARCQVRSGQVRHTNKPSMPASVNIKASAHSSLRLKRRKDSRV